jgi:large subunit ribosomal protein L4
VHAERSSLFGLDAGGFDAPSTRQAADLIADRRGGSVLVIVDPSELVAGKSFRNLAGVTVLAAEDAGVADIVGAATLVASQAAIDNLTARARKADRLQRQDAAGRDQNAGPDASRSNASKEVAA